MVLSATLRKEKKMNKATNNNTTTKAITAGVAYVESIEKASARLWAFGEAIAQAVENGGGKRDGAQGFHDGGGGVARSEVLPHVRFGGVGVVVDSERGQWSFVGYGVGVRCGQVGEGFCREAHEGRDS
jgi:hypothetical protein